MIKGHWGTFRHTTESFFILVHGKRLQNSTVQWQFNANNMVILAFLAIALGMYKQTETINLISLFFFTYISIHNILSFFRAYDYM